MNLALSVAVFAVCLLVLARIADLLVDAVMVIASRLRLSGAVAGATFAAAATSAPELGTTVAALMQGDVAVTDVGVGTVIGSAVFNLVAVVGVVALAGRATISARVLSRDLLVYALAVVGLLVCVLWLGQAQRTISRAEATALLGGYALYIAWIVQHARVRRTTPGRAAAPGELDADGGDPGRGSLVSALVKLVLGAGIVAAACHFLVLSVRTIVLWGGERLDLAPDMVASVTSMVIVAAVTSVPDAFTSLAAARRGQASLAVANAVGSNTFDILVCLGLPYAVIGGQPIARPIVWAMGLLLGSVALLFVLLRRRELRRSHGVILLSTYGVFVILVVAAGLYLGG